LRVENILKEMKILYIEDDDLVRDSMAKTLEFICKSVHSANNGMRGLELFDEVKPNMIITDIDMPSLNGLDFIKRIRQRDEKIPIVITSGHKDEKYLLEAVKLHLEDYLVKPMTYSDVLKSVEKCAKRIITNGDAYIEISESCNFNILKGSIERDDKEIFLTKKENVILKLLLENRDRIVYYEEIEDIAWEDEPMSKSSLKTIITKLRQKANLKITSHSKLGYRVDKEKE